MRITNEKKKSYLILFIFWVFSILIRGYKFGSGNHKQQLPLIFKSADPSLYSKDFIFNYSHGNSFYYNITGYITNFLGTETTLFILYLFASALYILAIYKLTKYLFKNNSISFLAIALLILLKPSFGTDLTFRDTIYHITIAIPILLFSLYYFLKKNYIKSFILLGIAFNLHGLSSLHLFGLYCIYFLLKFNNLNKKKFIMGGLLFVLLITPLVLSSDTASYSLFSADKSWTNLLKSLDHSHAFPSQWDPHQFLMNIPIIILGVLSFIYLKSKKLYIQNKNTHNETLILSSGFIVLGFFGLIFSEFYQIEFIIASQLFRSTLFLTTLIVIYASALIFELFKNKTGSKILSLILFSSLFFYDYVTLWLTLPLLFCLVYKGKIRNLGNLTIFSYISVLVIILSYCILIKDFYIIMAIARHLVIPLITFILLITTLKLMAKKLTSKNIIAFTIIVLIILSGISFISEKASLKQRIDYPNNVQQTEWIFLMDWVNKNTDKDSLFLIPPYKKDFRANAVRSVYIDMSTGPVYFSKEAAKEWMERLEKINISPGDKFSKISVEKKYNSLEEEFILSLSKEYLIDYVVFPKTKKLNLPKAYENKKYTVYIIKNLE